MEEGRYDGALNARVERGCSRVRPDVLLVLIVFGDAADGSAATILCRHPPLRNGRYRADDRSFVDLNQSQKCCRYDGHGACRVVALGTDVSDLIGPGQWEMHHENQRSPEDGS